MPAAQGHNGELKEYDAAAEPFFTVNWIHRYANGEDLALAEEEAEEIRAETLRRVADVTALRALYDGNAEQFRELIFAVIEETAALGRLLEWSEVGALQDNPNQIVVDL